MAEIPSGEDRVFIDRLVRERIDREVKRYRWIITTLIGLIAGNVTAAVALKGCIQDAAVIQAEGAALDRLEDKSSSANRRIESSNDDIDGLRKKVGGMESLVTGFVNQVNDHERDLNDASDRVQQTKKRMDKLRKATGLSENQLRLVTDLLTNAKSGNLQEFVDLCYARIEPLDLPVGTILPWHKNVNLKPGEKPKKLPSGWVPCNGPIDPQEYPNLAGGPVDLSQIPNLNKLENGRQGGRFLRGGETSGVKKDGTCTGIRPVVPPVHDITHPTWMTRTVLL